MGVELSGGPPVGRTSIESVTCTVSIEAARESDDKTEDEFSTATVITDGATVTKEVTVAGTVQLSSDLVLLVVSRVEQSRTHGSSTDIYETQVKLILT